MDSYWDLYVTYINHCVRYNFENDIDPHHYRMEWNHTLPRCIFGEQPVGQYLLLSQHAIASALQTLSFEENCLCGWHLKYLPSLLKDLCWTYYIRFQTKNGKKSGAITKEKQRGIHSPGVRTSETCSRGGKAGGKKQYESGIGMFSPGYITNDMRSNAGKIGSSVTNSQKWRCKVTGYVSTGAGLSQYQKKRNIDTSFRERVG